MTTLQLWGWLVLIAAVAISALMWIGKRRAPEEDEKVARLRVQDDDGFIKLVPKFERTQKGFFKLHKDESQEKPFSFTLHAGGVRAEEIMESQRYSSRADAVKGMNSVVWNAAASRYRDET